MTMTAAKRPLRTLAIGLAALTALQVATACEITRTPWGTRLTGCQLKELFNGRYDLSIDTRTDGLERVLKLPNLVVTDVDGSAAATPGRSVDVLAELRNEGIGNAGAFETVVVATVHDPLQAGSLASMSSLGPVSVAGLPAGGSATTVVGRVLLPNRKQDWDVCMAAVADAPAAGRPPSGAVLESNETDNQRNDCCRVYGPNPDTVHGPPACQQ
jgi:hypothetical protein